MGNVANVRCLFGSTLDVVVVGACDTLYLA